MWNIACQRRSLLEHKVGEPYGAGAVGDGWCHRNAQDTLSDISAINGRMQAASERVTDMAVIMANDAAFKTEFIERESEG